MSLFSTGIGIDVSDHHVRIAQVGRGGTPTGLYELVLPHGLIVDDKVEKKETLKKLLGKLIVKSGLDEISANTVLLIPESRVFSTSFQLEKKLKRNEFRNQAMKEGQRRIPIPFQNAIVEISPGLSVKDGVRVSIHVVQKLIIDGIKKAFLRPNFPVHAIEANNLALFRLFEAFGSKELQLKSIASLLMVVDIGHRWTNISLYDKMYTSIFSRSLAIRTLAESGKGEVSELTTKDIEKICQGIKDTVDYFQGSGSNIQSVLIAGVEGSQKNFLDQCRELNPKIKMNTLGEVVNVPEISARDVHTYGAAIGAAIRAARLRHYQKNHNFLKI